MSGKTLVFLALVAAAGYGLSRHTPPPPPNATAADSAAVMNAGIGDRFSYGVGRVGSKMVAKLVTGMVTTTEQSLTDMRPGIKKARGGDAIRAKEFAGRVTAADSSATVNLQYGRPIKAIQDAMAAKDLLNAVRQQVQRNI